MGERERERGHNRESKLARKTQNQQATSYGVLGELCGETRQ